MKYQLHCFAESGNCYKAALMLNLCQADWEPVFVDYFNDGHKSQEFRAINSMGEVPVLDAGGLRLTQSGVILDYLAEEFDQFDSANVPQHREILRWLLFDNHKLTGNVASLRWMLRFAKTGETPVTEFMRSRALQAMGVLNRQLASREYIIGEQPTIADLSLCGYLFYTDELGFELGKYTEVTRWLDQIQQLNGWRSPYELMPVSESAPI